MMCNVRIKESGLRCALFAICAAACLALIFVTENVYWVFGSFAFSGIAALFEPDYPSGL